MPLRKTFLNSGEIYHIYNRGVEGRPIFHDKRDYRRFIEGLEYYRLADLGIKLSNFKTFSREEKENFLRTHPDRLIELFCHSLMPNHLHFLLRQEKDGGISFFMALLTSSYSHYFNIRHERFGPLFQGPFKAVRVETDEQLIHLSRYIHLNSLMAGLIKDTRDLENYEWSSLPGYLDKNRKRDFYSTDLVLSFFKNSEDYKKFLEDHINYAKKLDHIKHLILE